MIGHQPLELLAGVLAALIAVVQQAVRLCTRLVPAAMKHRKGIDLVAPIRPSHYEEHKPSASVYETLNGLREWEVLGARCGHCGHTAWLDKRKVVQSYGKRYLQNVGHRLVCRCGNREDNKVLIGRLRVGPVWTPLNPSDKEAQKVSEFGAKTPMKRPAQPEEIAPAYVFLASPHCSSYITGEIIPIIGGY
jgi:hypothetical protein